MKDGRYDWRILLLLLAFTVCGVAASFPFIFSLYADKLATASIPLPAVVGLALLQNTIILAVMIGVGLFLTAKLGLPGTPLIHGRLSGNALRIRFRSLIQSALTTGIGVGVAVILLFFVVLKHELADLPLGKAGFMPVWKRVLLCFYGGLTEEIMMRIFMFSLLAWLFNKLWRHDDAGGLPRAGVLVTSNIVLAVIFGLGHLASVIPLMPITLHILLGALLLNGVASIAFTSLYLRRGLEAAMLAHFIADFMIWVIGPSFIVR